MNETSRPLLGVHGRVSACPFAVGGPQVWVVGGVEGTETEVGLEMPCVGPRSGRVVSRGVGRSLLPMQRPW